MTVSNITNSNPAKVRIFIVRHGQTDHNVQKILQGHVNTPLNATGIEQAKKVGERFRNVPVDGFITSDLQRCANTISEITKLHPESSKRIVVTEDLSERNMGEVEGLKITDAIAQYGEKNFRNLGEQLPMIVARVSRKWDYVVNDSIDNDYKNYILCSHGGVITAFTNHLHDLGYLLEEGLTKEKLKVPFNTSVTVVDIDKSTKEGHIVMFGDTEHLGGQFEVKNQLLR